MSPRNFLKLRLAQAEHLEAIWQIVQAHQETFVDDYHAPDLEWLVVAQLMVVLAEQRVVGVVAVSNISADALHGELHFLLTPSYLRQAVREQLFWQVIHAVFMNYDLQKIKVALMATQTVGIKILKQLGFRAVGFFQGETRKNGESMDIWWYEMTRSGWQF